VLKQTFWKNSTKSKLKKPIIYQKPSETGNIFEQFAARLGWPSRGALDADSRDVTDILLFLILS
jgi:hypothetical protein